MRLSALAGRVSGPGSDVWDDHYDAAERKAAGEDVIIMSVGDPDFDTSPTIVAAAVQALHAGDTHYTDVAGRNRLRRAVAAYVNDLSQTAYDDTNVVITAGTQNALYAAAALLVDPGDDVIVLEPSFTTYRASIESTGAHMVSVPCPSNRGYQPDIAALARAIGPRTRAIFYASPANPTGAVFDADSLGAIAAIARANNLWVVSDEVYADFIFDGTHHSIAALEGMAERTIIVGSMSKSHAMTGWRVGWAVGPQHFSAAFANLNLALTYGLPGFVQEAAAAGLEDRPVEIDALKARFRQRRDLVLAHLADAAGLAVMPPAAGMFVMIDIRATGLSGKAFARQLYATHRVSILDGAEFGPSGEGFVRLSFASTERDLAEGCRRLRAFAAELVGRTERHLG